MEDLNAHLLRQLNPDILYQHLYPYTYHSPPSMLLRDIRSYKKDIDLIYSIYETQYNERMLNNDLMYYMTNKHMKDTRFEPYKPAYHTIYLRAFSNEIPTVDELDKMHCRMFQSRIVNNDCVVVKRQNRNLLALMTVEERNHFIEQYILGIDQ